MSDDPKSTADPAKEDKGKQPAVDSDDEHDHDHDHDHDHEETTGEAGSGKAHKKKRSKKKKSAAAAAAEATATTEAAAAAAEATGAEADIKKSLAALPPAQLQELLKLNPAVAQEASASGSGSDGASSVTASHAAALEMLKKLSLGDIMTGLATSGKNVKDMASYRFWKTQPVPRFGEDEAAETVEGPIQQLTVDDVDKEPPKLVEGFEWDRIDLTDDAQLTEVFDLLSLHFVEDGEAMFRFRYSKSILKWAMMSPGWIPEWHIGVRATQSRKLVAFISAIPLDLRVRDKTLKCAEVNFLVVHKKLRSKRLAPILIKEITRLCNLRGVWQALYTAGVVLPKPVSTSRYYHRSINWMKLYDVGFSPLPTGSKPQFQVRKYALPDRTATPGLREMTLADVPAVQSLLTRYLSRFDMAMDFNNAEIEHWMLDNKVPGDERVVYSYVVEDPKDKDHRITDFFSFYCLESSVINHPRHKLIRAAYLFYYATEVGLTTPLDKAALKSRLNVLMSDALILAKKEKFDVLNALSIMDNALFLEQQKYGAGDGQLHYYLFNYRAKPIAGGVDWNNRLDEDKLSGIGFVMM